MVNTWTAFYKWHSLINTKIFFQNSTGYLGGRFWLFGENDLNLMLIAWYYQKQVSLD